jgi:hypothetical protein
MAAFCGLGVREVSIGIGGVVDLRKKRRKTRENEKNRCTPGVALGPELLGYAFT